MTKISLVYLRWDDDRFSPQYPPPIISKNMATPQFNTGAGECERSLEVVVRARPETSLNQRLVVLPVQHRFDTGNNIIHRQ